jgi:hypothetical protein
MSKPTVAANPTRDKVKRPRAIEAITFEMRSSLLLRAL